MAKLRLNTIIDPKTKKRFHRVGEATLECSGADCKFCNAHKEISFEDWESSIPYKMPKKGKRWKNPIAQKYRGQTIREICYSCKDTPCYICRRGDCKLWWKEADRKGQEKGCQWWENEKCTNFVCERGIIEESWVQRE